MEDIYTWKWLLLKNLRIARYQRLTSLIILPGYVAFVYAKKCCNMLEVVHSDSGAVWCAPILSETAESPQFHIWTGLVLIWIFFFCQGLEEPFYTTVHCQLSKSCWYALTIFIHCQYAVRQNRLKITAESSSFHHPWINLIPFAKHRVNLVSFKNVFWATSPCHTQSSFSWSPSAVHHLVSCNRWLTT